MIKTSHERYIISSCKNVYISNTAWQDIHSQIYKIPSCWRAENVIEIGDISMCVLESSAALYLCKILQKKSVRFSFWIDNWLIHSILDQRDFHFFNWQSKSLIALKSCISSALFYSWLLGQYVNLDKDFDSALVLLWLLSKQLLMEQELLI